MRRGWELMLGALATVALVGATGGIANAAEKQIVLSAGGMRLAPGTPLEDSGQIVIQTREVGYGCEVPPAEPAPEEAEALNVFSNGGASAEIRGWRPAVACAGDYVLLPPETGPGWDFTIGVKGSGPAAALSAVEYGPTGCRFAPVPGRRTKNTKSGRLTVTFGEKLLARTGACPSKSVTIEAIVHFTAGGEPVEATVQRV
jgi:hypothetical protein